MIGQHTLYCNRQLLSLEPKGRSEGDTHNWCRDDTYPKVRHQTIPRNVAPPDVF